MTFFQKNWETVKSDLKRTFDDFWSNGVINGLTNETYICLIPKKLHSCRIGDFRPISLVTGLYKIILKVLAERLKDVLEGTISEVQGAFVGGRQILDLALITNEVIEDYRSGRKEGIVFKIDFEKAYDRVEWKFLDFVLQQKGFGDRWRKWIEGCLSSVSFSIMINGRPRGKFQGSRGLRQGDPLSPYLFILVADVLSRLVGKAVDRQLFTPLRAGSQGEHISHLQFADDTLFFGVPEEENFSNLLCILEVFCSVSGLKINMEKSSVFGINVEEDRLSSIANTMGCSLGEWPTKYLGLPLGGNPLQHSFWEPVIVKITKRLAGWKKGFISKGGRLTLIQSVLSSLPVYYLSLFKIPKGVADSIEKLMRDFLWKGYDNENATHLVAWDRVCRPKCKGGLGIGNVVKRNEALLCKWLWRFPLEPDSLWHKVVKGKYGLSSNNWDAGRADRVTFRCAWKAIQFYAADFFNQVQWKVGAGNTVRFWEDVWRGENSFSDRFPSLYRLSLGHNEPINQFVQASS